MIIFESKKKISGLWIDDYEVEFKGWFVWVLIFFIISMILNILK